MSLLSMKFLLFLAAVLFFYYLVPKKVQWLVLLFGSVVFYLSYGYVQIAFLLAASVITYFAAVKMGGIYEKQEQYIKENEVSKEEKRDLQLKAKQSCKKILLFSVVLILAMLVYTKTAKQILSLLAGQLNKPALLDLKVIVALGISYYTFSAIGYLADVYWKKEKAEKNYLRLLLFLIYFPKILQGPIAKHKNLAGQLAELHSFDYKQFCFGLQLILYGYIKKAVIADRLAIFVTTVFGDVGSYTGSIYLVAAVFGTFQLYCDFSGCMDIAIGFSQALGIELEANFRRPFFSKTAAEFWRRWHITLGAWFKDYIYMPLVISPRIMKLAQKTKKTLGDRAGKAVVAVIPLSVVWILTGVWHGTGMNYIAWGIYWGVIIICSTVFEPELKKLTALLHINTQAKSWQIFQMVRTTLLFVIGRIITIPGNLKTSAYLFKQILFDFAPWSLLDGSLYKAGLNRQNFVLAVISLFVLWGISLWQEKGSVRESVSESNLVFRWMLYYLAIIVFVVFGVYGPGYNAASFAYMNF